MGQSILFEIKSNRLIDRSVRFCWYFHSAFRINFHQDELVDLCTSVLFSQRIFAKRCSSITIGSIPISCRWTMCLIILPVWRTWDWSNDKTKVQVNFISSQRSRRSTFEKEKQKCRFNTFKRNEQQINLNDKNESTNGLTSAKKMDPDDDLQEKSFSFKRLIEKLALLRNFSLIDDTQLSWRSRCFIQMTRYHSDRTRWEIPIVWLIKTKSKFSLFLVSNWIPFFCVFSVVQPETQQLR